MMLRHCLLVALCSASAAHAADAPKPFDAARFEGRYALVYAGPSAAEGCPEAVAAVASEIGLEVKYVRDPKRLPKLLEKAAVFIVGGTTGDMEPMRTAFTPEITRSLRDYLDGGGRYWGICGGAYLASREYDGYEGRVTALGLIPADALDHSTPRRAQLERVDWRGKPRDLYVAGSPSFRMKGKKAEILGTFGDGSIAAMIVPHGKGKVAVCGPHPEATTGWLEEDELETRGWEPTRPLAAELLKQLLTD